MDVERSDSLFCERLSLERIILCFDLAWEGAVWFSIISYGWVGHEIWCVQTLDMGFDYGTCETSYEDPLRHRLVDFHFVLLFFGFFFSPKRRLRR